MISRQDNPNNSNSCAGRNAHLLRGSSKSLRAQRMARLCARIEEACAEGSETTAALTEHLNEEFSARAQELREPGSSSTALTG